MQIDLESSNSTAFNLENLAYDLLTIKGYCYIRNLSK